MPESVVPRPPLLQRIGSGWLGDIHAAQARPGKNGPGDGGMLAVRSLSLERLADVGRIAQTMSFAAQHEHPHLLRPGLPQSDEQGAFYLMPLAQGGSLRGVFERYRAAGQTVDAPTMLDVLRQVAEGLDYAHARGVLHGNLKPENILLVPLPAPQQDEFRLVLTDFGLNSLRRPDPHSPYLPGPQRGGAAATLESDLYALGALLYEGVSGQPLPPQPLRADLIALPDSVSKVAARLLGLEQPFADMAALLGYLRALALASGASGVALQADRSGLSLAPGETQEVRVRLSSPEARPITLQIEGLPGDWAAPVSLELPPAQEVVVPLTVQVPRAHSVRAGQHEASILVLSAHRDGLGRSASLEVARLPLSVQVLPFSASALTLRPAGGSGGGGGARGLVGGAVRVGSSLSLSARLLNEGNQTQRYNLEINLPEGSTVKRGSARKQLELAPGREFIELLEVRLPPAWLSRRTFAITALANSLARPTPAEQGEEGAEKLDEVWPPVYDTVQAELMVSQRPVLPWWLLALLLVAGLGAGYWASRPPQIRSFGVQGAPPMQGQPFLLTWQTSGARQVSLAELPELKLDASGQLRLDGKTGPQTYTLVASGLLTRQRQQITVNPVAPAPRILGFTVSPQTARLGERVQVQWNVANVPEVTLEPFGVLPSRGSREYTMQRETRFTLQAGDKLSRTLRVALAPPLIESFNLQPTSALRGQEVTVSWKVTGASLVRLAPLGELPPAGRRTFRAQQSGSYTLKASNGQVETKASASLVVRVPQPRIAALTVTPQPIAIGDTVKVQWRTTDATRAEVRWGDQRQTVAPSGSLTFTATPATGSVTLVAFSEGREPAMQTQRLTLLRPNPVPARPTVSSAPAPAASRAATPAPSAAAPSASASRPTSPAPANQSVPRPPAPSRSKSEPATTTAGNRPASSRPASSAVKPAVKIQGFAFRRLGSAPTLVWRVSGVSRVQIAGLRGPNADGSFPASGSFTLQPSTSARTYSLRAGQKIASVRVPATATRPSQTTPATERPSAPPVSAGASSSPSTRRSEERPRASSPTSPATTPSAPAAPLYPNLAGTWNHSFGQLSVDVDGSRVSGSLISSRGDLPSGELRGRLSGSAQSPTLNAFIGSGPERVALIVQFDLVAHTFSGLYSSRSSRVPWCGWQAPAANPCP